LEHQNKIDVAAILEQRRFNPEYTPPAEDVIWTVQGHNIGSRQNFSVLAGLPKAGKSTFLAAIMASAFTTFEVYNNKLKFTGNMGYFDTESSTNDFYQNIRRVRQFAGFLELPNYYQAYNTRVDPFEHQRALIECYISQYNPAVLVIDGLLDLVRNFNDETESRALMDWLKFVTVKHNMLIIGCIHLGKKDNHTLGHFGSMVDRYAQSVIEIVRDFENDLYLMKPKMLRSAPIFETIAVQRVGSGFQQVPPPPVKKTK
jgi:hypothetical protein